MSDSISRTGVSAWLDNMGYPKLADAIMDEDKFPSTDTREISEKSRENIGQGGLIRRQAAIDAVSHACQEWRGIFGRCEDTLNELPSEDRPKGRWLSGDCKGAHCSVCDEYTPFTPAGRSYPFCPNCGAKMGGDTE